MRFRSLCMLLTLLPAESTAITNLQKGPQDVFEKYWGQLTPYRPAPASEFKLELPDNCRITFVQALARHGARNPRLSELEKLNRVLQKVKQGVASTENGWSNVAENHQFLKEYIVPGPHDELTAWGKLEARRMGEEFFQRYGSLASIGKLLIRTPLAVDETRLLETAELFAESFQKAFSKVYNGPQQSLRYKIDASSSGTTASPANNSLRHSKCRRFEEEAHGEKAKVEQITFLKNVVGPPVAQRINSIFTGAKVTSLEAARLLKLCPYSIVANLEEEKSDICKLFQNTDWKQFGYSETIMKFYRNGPGYELGPTQGIPWVKELIARVFKDRSYVTNDETAIDVQRDSKEETFPLGKHANMFADFTHGSDITSMLFALGVYRRDQIAIPLDGYYPEYATSNYSANWVVPFAARVYFEKLKCIEATHFPRRKKNIRYSNYIRVIVNDRVMNLTAHNSDPWGRERLEALKQAAAWALNDGNWQDCFGTPHPYQISQESS